MFMHEPAVAKPVTKETSQCTVRKYFAKNFLLNILSRIESKKN
jgi:hypothetical protein